MAFTLESDRLDPVTATFSPNVYASNDANDTMPTFIDMIGNLPAKRIRLQRLFPILLVAIAARRLDAYDRDPAGKVTQ